jgi:hypothetical protein
MGHRMRQIQYNQSKREEFMRNKEKGPDDKIRFKFEGHTKGDANRDFLAKLKQYDIDPVWLKDQ